MYEDTDYDALERNVKYVPWKGKKEEWYIWHKTFLVRAMMRGYHGILIGLESVPSDEVAKTFAGLTEMTSAQKKKFNNYKLNIRAYADLLQCCTQDIITSVSSTQRKIKSYPMAIRNLHGNVFLRNLRDKTMWKK